MSLKNNERMEYVECEGCGRLTPEDRIYVCSACDGEFCKSCMADINKAMVCKECDIYVGKHSKHIRDEWL